MDALDLARFAQWPLRFPHWYEYTLTWNIALASLLCAAARRYTERTPAENINSKLATVGPLMTDEEANEFRSWLAAR